MQNAPVSIVSAKQGELSRGVGSEQMNHEPGPAPEHRTSSAHMPLLIPGPEGDFPMTMRSGEDFIDKVGPHSYIKCVPRVALGDVFCSQGTRRLSAQCWREFP